MTIVSEDAIATICRRPVRRPSHLLPGRDQRRAPFREGNGRTQRAFVGQLAAEAGYHLAWKQLTPERNIEASVAERPRCTALR